MSNGVVTVAVDAFVMVVDGNGVVVQWSRQAEKLVGCTAEEVVGRPVAHLVTRIMAGACGGAAPGGGGRGALPPAAGPAARAPRRGPVAPRRGLGGRSLGEVRGRPCWVSGFRLGDRQGGVGGVGGVLGDAGELEKRRARLPLFSELRARLGRTLDVVATCQDVVDALVPGSADIAVLDVVDSVIRGEDPPLAPLGREVPLRRAAFRYSGGEPQIQAHQVGDVRPLPFPGPYAQVLPDLKPRVLDPRPDMPWLPADPARAEAIRASGARALLAVPLALRGALFGLLSLYRTAQAGSFDETEVDPPPPLPPPTPTPPPPPLSYPPPHTPPP